MHSTGVGAIRRSGALATQMGAKAAPAAPWSTVLSVDAVVMVSNSDVP
jgi:hypothetical protein